MSNEIFDSQELQECLASMRCRPVGPELPLRQSVCRDCAVKDGLYLVYSEALKLADESEQVAFSKQWFCHNTPNNACRGNACNLGIGW